MSAWRIVKYVVVGIISLGLLSLLLLALAVGQIAWSLRPHPRMTSTSPNGVSTLMMIEKHNLADTNVRIVLEREDRQTELLYTEDCWPQFLHFAWSSDSQRVVVAWRDDRCNHTEQPILKAWNLSGEEIPVDERLRARIAHDIRETYSQAKSMSSDEALSWALSGGDGLAWHRANPEPFWFCPWC